VALKGSRAALPRCSRREKVTPEPLLQRQLQLDQRVALVEHGVQIVEENPDARVADAELPAQLGSAHTHCLVSSAPVPSSPVSFFTTWYVVSDDDIDALLAEELAPPCQHLDNVGELELYALGEVLGVAYAVTPVRGEDGSEPLVLRVESTFLSALVGMRDVAAIATEWQERAEHLRGEAAGPLQALLSGMQAIARDGLAGAGVVSMPGS
jgi:hypothetical protein